MKKATLAIVLATTYLLVYQMGPFLRFDADIIVGMFVLSPFVVIGMVFMVLKYGKASELTFEDQFYEDANHGKQPADYND